MTPSVTMPAAAPDNSAPAAGLIPLTPLQQGMYFTWLRDPAAGIDVEQMVCTLPEVIDAPRLRAAWEETVISHPVLRSTFAPDSITIHPNLPFVWQESDWRDPTDGTGRCAQTRLSHLLDQDRRTPLSLTDGPLQRFHLIRLAPDSYQLIWTFHHILIDGRAITALLEQAFSRYDEPNSRFPALPSFPAHNHWQAGLDHTGSTAFWQSHLSGISSPTPLVVDHPIRTAPPVPHISERAAGTAPVQASADHWLPSSLTANLRDLADVHGVTLNTFVQAAFALLLSRYAGEDRIIFGATRACRHTPLPGSENTIGLLINTLPVKAVLPSSQPLLTLLKTLRQHWIDLREHEHTPLSFIRRTCGLSAAEAPFNHLLVFENDDYTNTLRANGGPNFAHRSFELHELTSVPLTLAVYGSTSLRLHCSWQPALFDHDTIQRLLGHMAWLLEQFVTLPLSTPLSDFTLTTLTERQLLLHDCQPNDPQVDSATTLHAWFSEIAQRHPQHIAVTAEDATWTYQELDRRANSIAHALSVSGVKPGDFVGICMDRRAPLIAALLGILKAGAAYLPIDLAYPPERLAFMLEDAQAAVLLTERPLAPRIPENRAATLFFEDIDFTDSHPACPSGEVPNDPDSLAYIIYTSGSTGLPKGCQITHRNVVRLMKATEGWYGFNHTDVWTLFHSTAFDFSVWELWGALLYGGRLVVVPWLTTRSPDDFFKLLCEEGVTVLNQTPSAFRQLIQAEPLARGAHPNLPPQALRHVIFGGEALEMQSLKPWFERHGDSSPRLVNMYGITETTVHVTYRPLSAKDLESGSVIGVPIPDLQLYILDPINRQPVPIGIPGEMYVGGKGLARGYLRRDELTADRFLPNHLTDTGRLYKTGDLARFIPAQGSTGLDIEYLGRIDQQVKIRGFRIELGEIENVLTSHFAVLEAAVLAREDRPGDKRLCAYLVSGPDRPTPDSLRALLKTRVPDYMVPAAFVFLEKLPLTPNGKLDRKALPPPLSDAPANDRHFLAPTTPAEAALTTIWSQVLRLDRVSTTDNFFEIGGDSILSIQVIARAREAGLGLSPRQLFENPTITALASAATPLNAQNSVLNSPAEDLINPFPLTPIQRWFFEQKLEGSHHWNQSFLFTLSDRLEPATLHRALHALTSRHPALRLRFRSEGPAWFPSIAEMETGDLLSVYPDLRDIEARCAELQSTLNYQTGPVIRGALFDAGEDRPGRLCLAIHHLAIDGVSWRILLEDLESILTGQPMPAPTASWPQWARQLARWPTTAEAQIRIPFWSAVTPAAAAPLTLEKDTFTHVVALTESQTAALLHNAPAAYRTRINDLLLTALALAYQSTQSKDSCPSLSLNLEGHGREESISGGLTLDRTIGWFTSLFPVCLTLPSADPADAIPSIKEQLRAIPDNGASHQLLAPASGHNQSAISNHLVFNYLGQFDALISGSNLFSFAPESTGPWHSPQASRAHATEINAMVIRGRLETTFASASPAHSPESLSVFAEAFLTALRSVISHCLTTTTPRFTPSDFPLSGLDQASLDNLPATNPGAEDICRLSPMQGLFHNAALTKPNAGFDQWHCRIGGPLDVAALKAAWALVVQRHTILRSTFHYAGLPHPVMVVHSTAIPDFTVMDAEGSNAITVFLTSEASGVNDLTKAPCGRFTLLRLAPDDHFFCWSVPDLQLDGWSWPIVFSEAAAAYRAFTTHTTPLLPHPRPYRDYLAWLERQTEAASDEFWHSSLTGFKSPTPVPVDSLPGPRASRRTAETHLTLTAPESATITTTARRLGVTPGVLAQAAWAALLSHASGSRDVVHGSAFSGRPADLPGADRIVGPFVNNLPVRSQLDPGRPAAEFLRSVHGHLTDLSAHQSTPLPRIQDCSAVPWRYRLFESILVFQNYQVDESLTCLGPETKLSEFEGPIHTSFPVTVVVTPGTTWKLLLVYQEAACSAARAQQILSSFQILLQSFAATPEAPLSQHLAVLLLPASSSPVAPAIESRISNLKPPATVMEHRLADIWRRAFGLTEVSTTDNFFDLGGHSLLMLRVHLAICQELGRPLPVVALFQYPTIQTLAAFLDPAPEPVATATPISIIQTRAGAARAAAQRAAAARR